MRNYLTVIGLFLASNALAATVVALSEEQLAKKADTIAFGSVVANEVRTTPEGRVFTRSVLQVYDGIKAVDRGAYVYIDVPGGQRADGLTFHVPGAPNLQPGDLILGFFENRGEAKLAMGLSYGILRVVLGEDGKYRVYDQTDRLGTVRPPRAAGEPLSVRGEPLQTVMNRIRGHLGLPAKVGLDGPALPNGVVGQ
jgi:hypothetical protein